MPKFTLHLKMYEGCYTPKFAFEAVDEAEAISKAKGWAIYHSFSIHDVKVFPSTAQEAQHWLHNEYVN